jgi:hypothetical protein
MMFILALTLCSLFLGFAIGRVGDKFGGHLNTFHHWIPGLIFIVGGSAWYWEPLGIMTISFGFGLFVSDLDDFLNMRVYGIDEPHEWKFWSIK